MRSNISIYGEQEGKIDVDAKTRLINFVTDARAVLSEKLLGQILHSYT